MAKQIFYDIIENEFWQKAESSSGAGEPIFWGECFLGARMCFDRLLGQGESLAPDPSANLVGE